MTPQQLVGTAVRLFALWLFFYSLIFLMSILPGIFADLPYKRHDIVVGSYMLGGVGLVVSILLWLFPLVIANLLIPRTRYTNHLSFSASARELARIGCALLGLWMFCKALPALVWFIFWSMLLTNDTSSSFSTLDAQGKLKLAFALFQVAFAVLVIVKAGAFARFVLPDSEAS